MTALLMAALGADVMAQANCRTDQSQPVLPRNSSSVSGHGTLVVNNEGADVVIRAENLTPGVAYNTWFLYFDNTAQCLVPHQCGNADLSAPASNPAGVLGRLDSAVSGDNGQLTFKGTLRDFHLSAGSSVHIACMPMARWISRIIWRMRGSCSHRNPRHWERPVWVSVPRKVFLWPAPYSRSDPASSHRSH